MTGSQILAMFGIAAGVGLLLALEHLACRGAKLTQQVRYAMGVCTLLLGLLGWAAWCNLSWPVVLGLVVVLLAPGLPTFLLFFQRDVAQARQERDAARQELHQAHLKAALLKADPQTRHSLKRLTALSDDIRFAAAMLCDSQETAKGDLGLFLRQIRSILDTLEDSTDD